MVIATQNPIEQAGTYRLPEAQLDRFLMKTSVGYPDRRGDRRAPRRRRGPRPCRPRPPGDHRRDVAPDERSADEVHVDPVDLGYVRELAEESRRQPARQARALRPWLPGLGPGRQDLGRRPTAATTSYPTTSRTWPSRCCATGCCSTPTPSSAASGRDRDHATCSTTVAPPTDRAGPTRLPALDAERRRDVHRVDRDRPRRGVGGGRGLGRLRRAAPGSRCSRARPALRGGAGGRPGPRRDPLELRPSSTVAGRPGRAVLRVTNRGRRARATPGDQRPRAPRRPTGPHPGPPAGAAQRRDARAADRPARHRARHRGGRAGGLTSYRPPRTVRAPQPVVGRRRPRGAPAHDQIESIAPGHVPDHDGSPSERVR